MNILVILTSVVASTVQTPVGCAAVRAPLPAVGACAATPHGVSLAASQARADELAAGAAAGEARFRRAFDKEPAAYAVFDFDDPAQIASTRATLKQVGYAIALPTRSPGMRAAGRERAAGALQASGAPAGATVRSVTTTASAGEPRDEANFVPHELGHLWYAAAFWADAPRSTGDRYGSAAPDWLDEVAAILMEDEAAAQAHRRRFADGRSDDPQRAAATPPEIPLPAFVTMAHPVAASLPTSGGNGAPVMIVGKPSLFYAQGRVFADYLIERSGDPRILASISEGLRSGGAFDDWLAREGRRHRLPSSLAAMDGDWRAWLERRFGPAF